MPHVPFERFTLPNGLRIVLSHDDRAPIVAVNLWYDVGSRHERPGRTGFAHLFEHLMFSGSAHVAKGEHFQLIASAGGTNNASTMNDATNYYETLPSHELELALWLEADRMASLPAAITQEKLDNQRDVVKNERRSAVDNQPYGTWDEEIQARLYPEGHPYHHPPIGSMQDLSAASLDDVTSFFATYYAPNNAVLTVAGDFDQPTALAHIERYFGPIPRNPNLPPHPDMSVDPAFGGGQRGDVFDQVELPRVHLAHRIPPLGTVGFRAFEVVSDLLGTGRAARLYRSLVREQQVAQDVVAFTFPWAGGSAMLACWATAKPDVPIERAEAALVAEFDRLATEGPSDAELDRVRTLHAAEVEGSLEMVSERADRLSHYTCLLDDPDLINREVEGYADVDRGQVVEAIGEYSRADRRLTLTYRPDPDMADEVEDP